MLMPGHPTAEFPDYIWDIMIADESTYSEREKKIVLDLVDAGEVYWVDCVEEMGHYVYTTDFGDPANILRMEVPKWVKKRNALRALSQALFTMGN